MLGENSFLLIEGSGTLDRVDVKDDGFVVAPIRGGFRELSPPLAFRIYAVPLTGK
jgi:hypothetical protein